MIFYFTIAAFLAIVASVLVNYVAERPASPFGRGVQRGGCVVVVYGALGFFLPMLLSTGLLVQPPVSLELPAGWAGDSDTDARGNVYAALTPYGRIQKYNAAGRYLGGWWIEGSAGGSLAVSVDPDQNVVVQTHKAHRRDVYSASGIRLTSEPTAPESWVAPGNRRWIRTSPLLVAWSKPLYALFTAVAGMLIVGVGSRLK